MVKCTSTPRKTPPERVLSPPAPPTAAATTRTSSPSARGPPVPLLLAVVVSIVLMTAATARYVLAGGVVVGLVVFEAAHDLLELQAGCGEGLMGRGVVSVVSVVRKELIGGDFDVVVSRLL